MGSRIPYGYEIIGGKAYINEREAARLKLYFRRFLDGLSMSAAAMEARLPFSTSTYRNLLMRKDYTGTDYYPPIITPEYRQRLIAEYKSRQGENPGQSRKPKKKGVKIYTDFCFVRAGGFEEGNPVDCAAALYRRIRPKYKSEKKASNSI